MINCVKYSVILYELRVIKRAEIAACLKYFFARDFGGNDAFLKTAVCSNSAVGGNYHAVSSAFGSPVIPCTV